MTDLDELAFTTATIRDTDSVGPLDGDTVFRGVDYRFTRRAAEDPTRNDWGLWYDLDPIVPSTGFPMRAIGLFRADDSVRWTSFGCRAFTADADHRTMFKDFLRRLRNETATSAHWDALCLAHYPDDVLEEVRRDCVRLFLTRDSLLSLTAAERAKLDSLIATLTENGG